MTPPSELSRKRSRFRRKAVYQDPKQLLNKRMNTALGQDPSLGITWCWPQYNWNAALQATLGILVPGHYIARWQVTCVLLSNRVKKDSSKCPRLRTTSYSLLFLSPSLAKTTVHSWRKWECTYIILQWSQPVLHQRLRRCCEEILCPISQPVRKDRRQWILVSLALYLLFLWVGQAL